MTDYTLAHAFVSALAPIDTVHDWRALHDTNKADPGHARRGTLDQMWPWLCQMNEAGYGIFMTIAAMDGIGRSLDNVAYVRAHYVDLDNSMAQVNYERAAQWIPAPAFAVQSSATKYHVYWPVQPYAGNDRFMAVQRKLVQHFDSDKRIIDATRVMRVPGTLHLKGAPHLVTCHALPGYGQPLTVEALEAALSGVVAVDGGSERHDLGDPELAAPNLEWLQYGLGLLDPNMLDRGEWVSIMAGFKQAGWTLTDPDTLKGMFFNWCTRYTNNNPGENEKQWNSLRNTQLGWRSLVARIPGLREAMAFGAPAQGGGGAQQQPMPTVVADLSSEILDEIDQREYFKDCVYVTKFGQILSNNRFMNATQFNGAYGGKQFKITSTGKLTDEPWKAATRSTVWTIPKVDHVRFLPHEPRGAIVADDLGRLGVNLYSPPTIKRQEGDPAPFVQHIASLIPDENDQRIFIEWLAHNVKFPGYKIPWAPVIQSVEGAGKGVIKAVMEHALSPTYCHYPNAKELTASGSTFNGWIRNKLFILADEIKVDDKRDLIEVLKPLISEKRIEIQSKGVDQEVEDNFANWMFFTNYKDAVPVSKNGRRYAIFYSPLQTAADLIARGMDDAYFDALYGWLELGGAAIVTDWLLKHPVQRGKIPMRAPRTASWDEAVRVSRTPAERCISEAIENAMEGFKGGWVSVQRAINHVKDQGITRAPMAPHVVGGILESMGYVSCGKAPRAWFPESMPSDLFYLGGFMDVAHYARAQGWE